MIKFNQEGFSTLIFLGTILVICILIVIASLYIKNNIQENPKEVSEDKLISIPPTFPNPQLSVTPEPSVEPYIGLYSPWPTKRPVSEKIINNVEMITFLKECQVIGIFRPHNQRNRVSLTDGSEKVFDESKYSTKDSEEIDIFIRDNPERCGFKLSLPIE